MNDSLRKPGSSQDFEKLLEYIKNSRGFDFREYKRTTLRRRVAKRMQAVRLETYETYLDYLEVHPEEFDQLFNTILINVTRFFREPEAWEYLRSQIFPELLGKKAENSRIRCWSAGCASGEEAYTLAMLLAEHLGTPAFRERVKIYATDVDEEALAQARVGIYSEKALEEAPPQFRSKYFEKSGGRCAFRADLRRQVIFGRHDLVQDAPISHLNLIVCRNTLMYFNSEAQARIVGRLHFALEDSGYCFLGKAEMLPASGRLFRPVDLSLRIFAKIPRDLRERMSFLVGNQEAQAMRTPKLRDVAFDVSPVAQLVLDRQGILRAANRKARSEFGISGEDIGRPFQDLEVSYRPVELRSAIDQLYLERSPVVLNDVKRPNKDQIEHWTVNLELIGDDSEVDAGVSITLTDISRVRQLEKELQNSSHELETAFEELQSTNEELETTNEELQSTVEELETTNEELQSTNEELETMNEELQSTNEELETVNDELRLRSEELFNANSFQEALLRSVPFAIALVDKDLNVRVWNPAAESLWGVRSDESRDRPLLDLEVGFDPGRLKAPLKRVLSGEIQSEVVTIQAVNRRGHPVIVHFTCGPFLRPGDELEGAIVVMTPADSEPAKPGKGGQQA